MNNKFVNLERVKNMTTLSESEIDSLIDDESFPTPIEIIPGKHAWLKKEIQDWIKQKAREHKNKLSEI